MTDDEDLLMRCDSLLSLIRHREHSGLTEQTIRDLDVLLPKLRTRTDAILYAHRWTAPPSTIGQGPQPRA